jgi:hypothetical protein
VQFEPGKESHVISHPAHLPDAQVCAPEQVSEGTYDVLAADVFNLGKLLQWELCDAEKVRHVHKFDSYSLVGNI